MIRIVLRDLVYTFVCLRFCDVLCIFTGFSAFGVLQCVSAPWCVQHVFDAWHRLAELREGTRQDIERTNIRFSRNISAGCRLVFLSLLLRGSAAIGSHFRFARISAGPDHAPPVGRGPASGRDLPGPGLWVIESVLYSYIVLFS